MLWNTGEDKMIEGFLVAVQFLTRLPIGKTVTFNEKNISICVLFFPLVGIIIGGIGGLVYYIFAYINQSIASVFVILGLIVVTGGLHLDGLSDTVDGFFSCREKHKILEIMEDSRIGAFGVISIVMAILSKYIFINSLVGNIPLILSLSCGNSRLLIAYMISRKRTAKSEGLGYLFHQENQKRYALIGGSIYILAIILINIFYLIPLVLTFIIGQLISYISHKKIGGLTGDVYGATIELGEAISLLGFIGISKILLLNG